MILNTKRFYLILKIANAKKIVTRSLIKPKRSRKFKFPKRLNKGLDSDRFLVQNRNVVTFKSKDRSIDKHIFFLHGGAYVAEAKSVHWRMVENLVKNTSCKLSFIDYPLAPENSYKETHDMVFQAYSKLVELFPDDEFLFLGDSAGGGICLTLAQMIRNIRFKKMPEKIALLSPWVDISMSNPAIFELEKKDLLLDPAQLMMCSRSFAGEMDLKDPIVSPIYGDFEDLNNIGIFVGTHEILLPDCRELKRKIEQTNTEVFYKEYEAMQHDWMIFPIKESKILLNDVVDYLLN